MPNPYFSFKQFTVYHDRCAMKVGTDGVLIGAWAELPNDKSASVLDIGAGSGLVSLMLAQRFPESTIHSIEIDKDATNQANDNYTRAPFNNIRRCENTSLQRFSENTPLKFDLIVSNPPFFSRSLKSPDLQRSKARHTDSLPIEDFIALSAQLLLPEGALSFIFPSSETDNLIQIAQDFNLFPDRIMKVYPTPQSKDKRVLISFSFSQSGYLTDKLIIETARHRYSPEFIDLVKDFYLKM